MMKCKWTGDPADEYCKNCDGITMEVDGNSISCEECAGYEVGTEEVNASEESIMNEPVEEEPKKETPAERTKTAQKLKETKKTNNSTSKQEKSKYDANKSVTNDNDTVVKVTEEKKAEESVSTSNGEIKVTSLRYTSGATIKKGDNYFKFIAEEEWDVSRIEDVQEAREQLWAKLNAEVDSQIEELNNMN